MKRILTFLLTLALLGALLVPCFAANTDLVIDGADLLADSEEAILEDELLEKSDRLEFDIVVLTVDGLEGRDINAYADDYYDYNGYGRGDNHDGCMLIIDMDTRYYTMSTTGYGTTAITDYGLEVIYDEILDDIKNQDYLSAFEHYADIVEDYVIQARNGSPYDVNNNYGGYTADSFDYSDWDDNTPYKPDYAKGVIISLIVAVIIALIVTSMVKKSYKPVAFQSNATNYLNQGSLNISQSYERFLYNHVAMVKIQSESSSSGHSGGSSTHTSSSGMSHGGGGGRSF